MDDFRRHKRQRLAQNAKFADNGGSGRRPKAEGDDFDGAGDKEGDVGDPSAAEALDPEADEVGDDVFPMAQNLPRKLTFGQVNSQLFVEIDCEETPTPSIVAVDSAPAEMSAEGVATDVPEDNLLHLDLSKSPSSGSAPPSRSAPPTSSVQAAAAAAKAGGFQFAAAEAKPQFSIGDT